MKTYSFKKKITHFKNVIISIVKQKINNEDVLVLPIIAKDRREICNRCNFRKRSIFHKKFDRCYICGCFINSKIQIATESCPAEPPMWKMDVSLFSFQRPLDI